MQSDIETIKDRIYKYFTIGQSKEIDKIQEFLVDSPKYSKFCDSPPYDRLDISRAMTIKQLYFAAISDYQFTISNLKIDILKDIAIITFTVEMSGMIVDDYSFRGTTIRNTSRATFIMCKDKGQWLILHEHMSKIPN